MVDDRKLPKTVVSDGVRIWFKMTYVLLYFVDHRRLSQLGVSLFPESYVSRSIPELFSRHLGWSIYCQHADPWQMGPLSEYPLLRSICCSTWRHLSKYYDYNFTTNDDYNKQQRRSNHCSINSTILWHEFILSSYKICCVESLACLLLQVLITTKRPMRPAPRRFPHPSSTYSPLRL